MKSKSKVLLAFTMLFLVSTVACATSVSALKTGEVVKLHMSAEGPDLWDPQATVSINAHIGHDWVSSWTEEAYFEKIGWDPIENEEVILCQGRVSNCDAFYFNEWEAPNTGEIWDYVWIVQGIGTVKTQTTIYNEAQITIIFCMGGNWAWAGFVDPVSGDSGPTNTNPTGGHGTLTTPITVEEIGGDEYTIIKQEQETVMDVWLNGGNRITTDYVANIAETNYAVAGMLQTEEEKEENLFRLPWDWNMWLDGSELDIKSFWWYDEEGVLIGEPARLLVFYYIFEPYTLSMGWHTIENELSWYNDIGPNAWQEFQYVQWNFRVSRR